MLSPKSAPASLLAFAVAALLAAPLPAAAPAGEDLADAPSGSGHLLRAGGRRLSGESSEEPENETNDVELLFHVVEQLNLSDKSRKELRDKILVLNRTESMTYVFLDKAQITMSEGIRMVIVNRPVLIVTACVWVAVNTVGQLPRFYDKLKGYGAYLTFLSATVVVNIFYCNYGDEWFMHHNPVWSSIFFVTLGVVLRHLFRQKKWFSEDKLPDVSTPYPDPPENSARLLETTENSGSMTLNFKITNRYQEVSFPFMKLVFLFFVQTTLLMFYAIEMHENVDVHDADEVSYFKWFVGVCIVFSVGGDEMGSGFNPEFWEALEKSADTQSTDSLTESPSTESLANLDSHHFQGLLKHKTEWKIRKWMSFLINSAGKWYILSTFPVLLSNGDEYEFIMDCMATWFITSLDDLPNEKLLADDMLAELNEEKKRAGGGEITESGATQAAESREE